MHPWPDSYIDDTITGCRISCRTTAGRFAPPLPIDSSWPPLLTALQEQLGLKLDAARNPVDVLVIDSAEKPSAD